MNAEKPSIVRTLEQQRAAHAWKKLHEAKKEIPDKERQGKLKSVARNAPASIQSNGLGQTVAFWKAKQSKKEEADEYRLIYLALQEWLQMQMNFNEFLLDWIVTKATSAQYRHATAEAMAYLNWYKRFAEAELEGE